MDSPQSALGDSAHPELDRVEPQPSGANRLGMKPAGTGRPLDLLGREVIKGVGDQWLGCGGPGSRWADSSRW